VNPVLIYKILQKPEFNREWISPSGRLQGHFDIESFVYQLSVNTAETVSRSTSSTWRDIYKAGENFWKWYLTGEKIEDDTTYLYHQAVAGTIYVITMAYTDLLNLGIINKDGLERRNKLPPIRCVQDEGIELPSVSVDEKAIPAEETRPDPLRKASDVLGCETSGNSEVQKLIDEFENLYTKSSVSNRKGRLFSELLEKLEESAVQEYRIQAENLGDKFCPLRRMEHIPIDSDVSAHFGIETYRLPSLTECEDHSMFAHYMEKLDEHSEVAHKLELTMCAASLTHIKSKCQFSESRCRRLESLIDTLHEERDDTE
jgi:hypothetical protein